MNLLIQNNLVVLRTLCSRFEVSSMYVFGSAANGNFGPDSDLDFLIKFRRLPIDKYTDNYFELHYALEELFARPIDLITEPSIKNPYFMEQVNSTKQLIYTD